MDRNSFPKDRKMSNQTKPLSKFLPIPHPTMQEEPRDLSMKRKQVPPPLDLSKQTFALDALPNPTFHPTSPRDQKNLPLRKRAFSWSSQPEDDSMAGQDGQPTNMNQAYESESRYGLCSASQLPTPYTPTQHPSSAIPVSSSRFSFADAAHMQASHQPLNLSTGSMSTTPSALLSPAPSHFSSSPLSLSREELDQQEYATAHCMPHSGYQNTPVESSHAPLEQARSSPNTQNQVSSCIWSVFFPGVQCVFILPNSQIGAPFTSQGMAKQEKSMSLRYASHGVQVMNIGAEQHDRHRKVYFRPLIVNQYDVVATLPTAHMFFVRAKGWCNLTGEAVTDNVPHTCPVLQVGDVCLQHEEAGSIPMPTPYLTEAMQNFDLNDEKRAEGGRGMSGSNAAPRFQLLSPPPSPSKKSAKNASDASTKPRRPMNGFMLFGKRNRVNLIQLYPGKDNRAISVMLGGAWRNLSEGEREVYNAEARMSAEERKRIDPDCWKRKRSLSTS